ncbi:polymer-forming cytoskeletal protein [Bacteroidales bacterium OttesenSCG-928-K03]|nr:polymer-forming cytoskeletal protein [Odoribacter sp. OttesenSCG-928-L07]MDL2242205.1 polymer-forming cytoskeletal protein [Bacteroidales bacterium OttesenSCG-928-K03]
MGKETETEKTNCANIIQYGTSIIGNLETSGNIRIDGNVKGNVKALGKVIIGEQGFVEGDLECSNASIEGKCKANINVSELLELKSTAVFEGEINTSKIYIESGAVFLGSCKMKMEERIK